MKPSTRHPGSGRTGSFASLCLPSFVSRCFSAWMPGTALWVDGFVCLALSGCLARLLDGCICLPLFVSRCLPVWMPGMALWVDELFVSLCLWTNSFVFPRCVVRLSVADSFICLPLSLHLSPGWTDSFAADSSFLSPIVCGLICHPLCPICFLLFPSPEETAQRVARCPRLGGDNRRHMKGDKGRQMNPSSQSRARRDNGRQMKGDKGDK